MNLLAISLAFPPLAYPRSIQVARLLNHTDASTVLFCADEADARRDHTIEPDAEKKLKACIRIPVRQNFVNGIADRVAYRYFRGVWNRRNLIPDAYGSWKTAVLQAVTRYVSENNFRPDVIVTFAQPFTDHLIGMKLKNQLKLPWVAHFSDPWADNPFSPYDEATRLLNLKLERSVVEAADLLVFTSSETVDPFFKKYPRELKRKARVLPQCFDPESFRHADNMPAGKITIRYLGNFYGRRTPAPLVRGITELLSSKPGSLDDVAIELVGPGDGDNIRRLTTELPAGLLTARSSVNYRESLELMIDADGLLVIDAPADLSVFLPSKLIDYIGAERPIFGITPKGAAASLIRELDGSVANPADPHEVAARLEAFVEVLRDRRNSAHGSLFDPAVRERYTAGTVAVKFREMLNEVKIAN